MCFKQSTAVNLDFTNFCVPYTSPTISTNAEGRENYFHSITKTTLFEINKFEVSNILHVGTSKIPLLCDVDHMKLETDERYPLDATIYLLL